ncbi:hypothetical protein MKA31_12285 [[Clostridium] innocuum]|nr:hypothetical protein [[Clostridium] innocuum]DAE55048.1 MAG TPA: hypothetical protein [Caudoviricetes sp.]
MAFRGVMMAKIQNKGLNDYIKAIQRVKKGSDVIIRKGIYDGAGILADGMKQETKRLPTDNAYGTSDDPLKGISNRQKADIIEGMGIAPIRDDGDYVHAKIGWDGYGRTKTKKYPEGVPNQLIVRSINSGSSFRKKNPFVNRAVTKNKKTAVKAMADTIENEIKKEMK